MVGHGTLSNYRIPEEALDAKITLGRSSGEFHDNFLTLDVDAGTSNEALEIATEELQRFFRRLTLNQGRAFSWRVLVVEDEEKRIYRLPATLELASVSVYSTSKLKDDIEDSQTDLRTSDERTERALEYYEHAVFLYENRLQIAPLQSHHFRLLISAVFLNVWKAVTAVIGDPSTDKDYQRRYRQLGFDDEFFKNENRDNPRLAQRL